MSKDVEFVENLSNNCPKWLFKLLTRFFFIPYFTLNLWFVKFRLHCLDKYHITSAWWKLLLIFIASYVAVVLLTQY